MNYDVYLAVSREVRAKSVACGPRKVSQPLLLPFHYSNEQDKCRYGEDWAKAHSLLGVLSSQTAVRNAVEI